jgi:subtilisin family serine protease
MSGPTPAWSSIGTAGRRLPLLWPEPITRDWAWGGSTGRGVRVCIVDSGIDRDHPLVGPVDGAWVAVAGEDDEVSVVTDESGDVAGHGTACAGIVRAIAPDCALHSMRVLGPESTGSGRALLAGLSWAVEQGFDIINMSLSTRRREFTDVLRELADHAYFQRSLLVCSAHNMAVESFPWLFASVISVGSHDRAGLLEFDYNTRPPVEFFGRGIDVEVAWPGGGTTVASGNSFATPQIAGVCALILAKHPGLTPFEVKTMLYMTASNVTGREAG